MKMDKIGACTVIAAIATVARLAPGTPLLAVAPAVENMPGPHSTRPGDVVRALNGKMVDITNTDAEGRLILGDAMTYAERLGRDPHRRRRDPDRARSSRAFGHLVTGAFGTPQAWYDEVMAAADRAGERYWQIPLIDDYVPDMDSWYGDLQNAGSAEGSLVKSGLFLREFVTVPWVHLDIGGTGYFRKATPYAPRGATGVTHATLVELALAGAERRTDTPDRSGAASGRRDGPLAALGRPRVAGVARAVVADRFAARWPEHDEEHPAGRADRLADRSSSRSSGRSRSGCCRCGSPVTRSRSRLFGAWFATLVVGLATDLDQRLLPDELTLPVIPIALLYAVSGPNPLVGERPASPAILAAVDRAARAVPALDPVRGGGVRDRRREAAGRGRADGRRPAGAPAACSPGCSRPGSCSSCCWRRAGSPADVRPVRAVPDRRRALGGADPV